MPEMTLSKRWDVVNRLEARRAGLRHADLKPVTSPKAHGEVDVQDAWLEVPLGSAWLCAYRLIPQDGVPLLAEIRLFPNEQPRIRAGEWSAKWRGLKATVPPGGITSRLLREVKPGEHLRAAQGVFETFHKHDPSALASAGFSVMPATSRRGPKGLPDLLYAKVARDYMDHCEAGSRSPALDVARRRRISAPRVRRMLSEARRRGLLMGLTRRRSGGALTDRARMILEAPAAIDTASGRAKQGQTRNVPRNVPASTLGRPNKSS